MSSYRGFLDLPSRLRQRIYEYAGITGKVIDLNSWRWNEVFEREEAEDENTYHESVNHQITGKSFKPTCWHDGSDVLVRREEYFPVREYWECLRHGKRNYEPYNRDYNRCDKEDCFAWDSCFALLFTSKQIFSEIRDRIFEQNSFVVDRGHPRGFQPFVALGQYAIHRLTHLTIRLDGEPPKVIDMSCHWTRTADLLPLKHYSRHGKRAYKEWNSLVARMRDCSIAPQRLNFFLIASVRDSKEAKLILEPLESLASFKSCGIWLNQKPVSELQELIKDTATRLTTVKEEEAMMEAKINSSFHFLDLPPEIRLRILEFSDLCDSAHLEWKPTSSLLDRIAPRRLPSCTCYADLGYIDKYLHFEDCERELRIYPRDTRSGLETIYDNDVHCCICIRNDWYDRGLSCKMKNDPHMCIFNCSNHSAHLVTPKPQTWQPYCHPLFLVSRQVRQDAIPVFFQSRQLVITSRLSLPLRHLKRHPNDFYKWKNRIVLPRTELSLFVSAMPKDALRHIRRLEWLMPAPESFRKLSKAAYFDYLDTIEVMIQAMTLSKLTLVINWRIARDLNPEYQGYGCELWWPVRAKHDGSVYNAILNPLCSLGENGLKNCWVYLRRIWKRRYDEGYCLDIDEAKWERKIMRNDKYNAFEHGKQLPERVEIATVGLDVPQRLSREYGLYREHYPDWN